MAFLISDLRPTKAPNLPLGPVQYDQRYQDQLLNILRLYFNTLDNFSQQMVGGVGGSYLKFPRVAASDTTDQYATATNTPTKAAWNTAESLLGFTLNADGSATAEYPGVYKITYSLQFINTANAVYDAYVWLRVNGVDVPRSTTSFSVPARKSTGDPSYVCGYSEVMFELNAGDSVTLYWATNQAYSTTGPVDGVYIYAEPAQTTPYARPAIPSAIGSITFVSALST